MKIAIIIVRTLIGLLLVASSLVVLLKLAPQPELHGKIKIFQDGMEASGYLMPLVKVVELICGIAFLTGRFIPLASVIIFPITLNIVLFHAFLAPEGLVLPVLLLLGNLFLAYVNRRSYSPMMLAK